MLCASVLSNLPKRVRITNIITKYAFFVSEEVHLGVFPQRSEIFLSNLSQDSGHKSLKHKSAQNLYKCQQLRANIVFFSTCDNIKVQNKVNNKTLSWFNEMLWLVELVGSYSDCSNWWENRGDLTELQILSK